MSVDDMKRALTLYAKDLARKKLVKRKNNTCKVAKVTSAMDFCGIWQDGDNITTDEVKTEILSSRSFKRAIDDCIR